MNTILLNQLVIMFLYLLVGLGLRRANLVTGENSSGLSNFLLYVILPCVIICSFDQEASREKSIMLGVSILLGAVVLALAVFVSALLFPRHPMASFGGAFSNAGFMGIPLISALLGSETVFFTAGMVAMLNILQWTYGQSLLRGSRGRLSLMTLVKNPLVIAFVLGLLLYFLPLSLPSQISRAMESFVSCNAPVAMVILGVLLGNVSPRQLFGTKMAWSASAVRLLVIPLLTLALLTLPKSLSTDLKMALLIAASAPIGSNLAVYVQKQGGNSSEAASMVCLSTLLSAVTMPLILYLAEIIWA